MKGKVKDMVLQRIPQKVKLRENMTNGNKIFQIDDFCQGLEYKVYGVSKYKWSDGELELCYILTNDKGILVERACMKFVVIE